MDPVFQPSKINTDSNPLQGDIYNVIWDARAMPETSFPPADYPRGAAIDLGRLVEKEDMANFFIDFIKQDCLGVIAT